MDLFYSKSYDKHVGFTSSLENKNRIEELIKISSNIQNNTLEIPEYWKKVLVNLENIYETKKYNCQFCSFLNDSETFLNDSNVNFALCEMCGNKIGDVKIVSDIKGDTTYMCKDTLKCLEDLLKDIMFVLDYQIENKRNAFFLSRPPGHHSNNKNPSGFCLTNNISFAVDFLKSNCSKIAILDWDVHHGNGTQELFYDRSDVLFIDIHRDNFYPYTGNKNEKGIGLGFGYTVNILLEKGSDGKDYNNVFDEIVIPKLVEFDPDWILVSCGFDAHYLDPIGGMKLTEKDYFNFHQKLLKLNKPLTYFLEGGYNCKVVTNCVMEMMK
jgi:acetoin utilization deacetylase AcuC-like enzyme